MSNQNTGLETLQDIRRIMDRSSRFISLSGWSGVAAGVAATVGSFLAWGKVKDYYRNDYGTPNACPECLKNELLVIAGGVLAAAAILAFLFTYTRSRKEGVAIWGPSARRLMWNTLMPMAVGGLFLLKLMALKYYEVIPAGSLIFYGLALVNGSRFTLGEVRFLGYAQLLIGLFNLAYPQYSLYCWALGFGFMHIIYGVAMWLKYERN
ncbi:hypothetical protein KJS94_10160 [Flavihumibacter rivuli]|uniref:hypothetical protein n=1 Tax=Flavihumibacter rivuli TaxID=2838156 RepID=UPI001BDF4677|nr:hypothetical protein [Flavihumibacter rivuli]ULQ55001.1 hypothetical protein KJS94_10160 [Flavihumibacter rivuli]